MTDDERLAYARERLARSRAELAAAGQCLFWRTSKVEDLQERDELLEVCYGLFSLLEQERRWNRTCIDMSDTFENARQSLARHG